jgi:hypothetical protein
MNEFYPYFCYRAYARAAKCSPSEAEQTGRCRRRGRLLESSLHHPVPLNLSFLGRLILVPSSNTLVESIMALRAAILNVSICYLNVSFHLFMQCVDGIFIITRLVVSNSSCFHSKPFLICAESTKSIVAFSLWSASGSGYCCSCRCFFTGLRSSGTHHRYNNSRQWSSCCIGNCVGQ